MTPLISPIRAPTATTISKPSTPRLLALAPLSTSKLVATALSATTPSIERSIEPMMMMKVAPSPRHERDHRGLRDAHEIADGEKARVDRRDHDAEQDQDKHRRPGRQQTRDPAVGARRPPRGARRTRSGGGQNR